MAELAVNVETVNSNSISRNMRLAHDQLSKDGNPMAALFNPNTFGGLDNVQRQHIHPMMRNLGEFTALKTALKSCWFDLWMADSVA